MPEFIFAMVVGFLISAMRVLARKRRAPEPKPLCADCFYAHVQYAANGRRAISCTYGGGVRPMNLDVLYCSDYLARNVPVRVSAIGFVRASTPE